MTEFAWTPNDEYIANANVTRLMRTHGIASIDDLRRRSVEDVEWYWDAVGKGDSVGVYMPMVPHAVIAAYAIAKIGAIYMPIFSGFAPSAVAARLQDAGAKVLFTADGTWRRGKHGLMKESADEAVAESPTVERVVVLSNLGVEVPMTAGRDGTSAEVVAPHR